MKLFTWKDVERELKLNKQRWSDHILGVDVYPEELYVYSYEDKKDVLSLLSHILNCRINDNDEIELEIGREKLHIVIETPDEGTLSNDGNIIVPLFKNILYQVNSSYDSSVISTKLSGVPVIAFHSYKGGVGRTLSLLSFVKAWSEKRGKDKTLLVIDADVEAPGLSWICDEYNKEQTISYLDFLEMTQQSKDVDSLVNKVKDRIKISTFSFENKERVCTQYFMPTYRYQAQLLDVYASPQSIVQGYNKRYFIGDVLSCLGKELSVDAVVVDLRAGISEFSAPILFDPRIKKYIVSSTSYQSCIGTKLLLSQLLKGIEINEDSLMPEVLITMVQKNDDTEEIHAIVREPYESNITDDKQDLLDHVIYDFDYASELIRLDSLKGIMSALDERRCHEKMRDIVETNYPTNEIVMKEAYTIRNRERIINKIHCIAEKQLTAEGNENFPVMKTRAIKQLITVYAVEKPVAVIMGAKGAGKTYLYRELLKRKYWENFVNDMSGTNYDERTVIVPLLASESYTQLVNYLGGCINNYNRLLEEYKVDDIYYQNNRTKAKDMLGDYHSNHEWSDFWKGIMVPEGMTDLDRLNELCEKKGKRILFIVDGLEELFTNTLKRENERIAVSSLCKDVIGELKVKYDSISCLVFTRRDVIKNAVPTNFEQFSAQYKGLELLWSKAEALRLALWLVSEADEGFKEGLNGIEDAADNMIRRNLEKLWGKKLGKDISNEAYSSNWILAALSDFNGQLQARDIIRFLEYASSDTEIVTYEDRYIMPKDIKNAIPKCSQKKIEEIEQEIEILKPIFQKLKDVRDDDKKLPFTSGDFNLTKDEENILIQEGYLYNDMGKCYLPEIIRHALGFTYSKGARPKVLALMSRRK